MIKSKLLNLLLILASLIGYLERGGKKICFLLQTEKEIILKLFTQPATVLHPFTVLPPIGQPLLVCTLFQKKPSKILTYTSMAGL